MVFRGEYVYVVVLVLLLKNYIYFVVIEYEFEIEIVLFVNISYRGEPGIFCKFVFVPSGDAVLDGLPQFGLGILGTPSRGGSIGVHFRSMH